jgi:hypothetical protein
MIHDIGVAARVVLGGMSLDEAELRGIEAVDARKFDITGRGTDEAA